MPIVLLLLSVVCATVPMLVFLAFVWWLDRHDREPIWLFGLTFLWGALGATFLSLMGNETFMGIASAVVGPVMGDALGTVIGAPLIEEPMKAFILFAIMFSRHFDNATDGFVYGAAAGLGFGMTENFLYFSNVAMMGDVVGWLMTVVIRTLYSAVMHATASSCVGAMLGWARFRGPFAKLLALPIGFGVAMSIHALWNGLLTVDQFAQAGVFTLANFVLFPVEVAVVFVVFQLALWDERATIRRELADEVQQGLLPLDHARRIASYWGRSRGAWVPAGVPHGQYVKAATTLALRKHQCRNASSSSYGFYSEEVLRLRKEVQALLALAK
ncbi:MAG: PrsW family intramembrane metalloprotease [Myxococcota bacterium]